GVRDARHAARVELDLHPLRLLRPVPEDEGPRHQLELVSLREIPARRLLLAQLVAEQAQLFLDVYLTDAQAGVQLDRPGIDARGEGEAPPFEFARDAQVEVEGEGEKHAHAGEQRVAEIP